MLRGLESLMKSAAFLVSRGNGVSWASGNFPRRARETCSSMFRHPVKASCMPFLCLSAKRQGADW